MVFVWSVENKQVHEHVGNFVFGRGDQKPLFLCSDRAIPHGIHGCSALRLQDKHVQAALLLEGTLGLCRTRDRTVSSLTFQSFEM